MWSNQLNVSGNDQAHSTQTNGSSPVRPRRLLLAPAAATFAAVVVLLGIVVPVTLLLSVGALVGYALVNVLSAHHGEGLPTTTWSTLDAPRVRGR
jgi:hypothetical protein